MYCVLLCLVLFFNASLTRGSSDNEQSNVGIIDGKTVPISAYPYMASLHVSGYIQGSAVILNNNWILTTANNLHWVNETDVTIRVGSSHYNSGGDTYNATKIIMHHKFDVNISDWDYNVAVVRTAAPITFGDNVKSISLANGKLKAGTEATVSGWGEAKPEEGVASKVLRAVDVTVMDWQNCKRTYTRQLTARIICTFDKTVGPCAWDQGDPLVVNGEVYGMFGGGFGCDPGSVPVLYTFIPALKKWILKAIQN